MCLAGCHEIPQTQVKTGADFQLIVQKRDAILTIGTDFGLNGENDLIMKRLLLAVVALGFAVAAKAQVIVISGDAFRNPESQVKIKLVDSLTQEPLPMATVYLQPKGDTTIMYFNLSDTSGTAVLDGVVRGNYKLTAEFLGYRPFVKEFYFRKNKEDLGTVKMVEDAVLLEAATVSAVGNPIEIIKDTIVYNATMFRTADNAVLSELLKKMPGFEVASDGSVKVNGEPISKVTVNGKTFFFDDPTMAVKNLPAKIVDKIKITDYKSDEEKATGITNMVSKEKEMDIALKKEYEKGWFGNAKLAGGTPLSSDDNKNQPVIIDRDALYNGSLMLSGYNEKDQITIVANAKNVDDVGANDMIVVSYGVGDLIPDSGLTTSRQLGANYNSSRIKGFDFSSSVNYNGTEVDSETLTMRTTMQENAPSIYTNTSYLGETIQDRLNVSLDMNKTDKKKYTVRISPKFVYRKGSSESYKDIATSREMDGSSSASGLLNTSVAKDYSESDNFTYSTTVILGRSNWGKQNRNLTFTGSFSINGEDKQRKEFSDIYYSGSALSDTRDLYYDTKSEGGGYSARISYVEPVGKNWKISAELNSLLSQTDVTTDAYKYTGGEHSFVAGFPDRDRYTEYDDYYSAVSENRYLENSGQLLAQYNKGTTRVQVGGSASAVNNETYSKTYGIAQTTGKGEWLWNWAPFVRLGFTGKKGANYNFNYSGRMENVSNSQLSPVPDISNPTYITFGNIYLEPYSTHTFALYANYNNKKNFSFMTAVLSGSRSMNGVVNANWFDEEGVQYNVPVNSKKGVTNLTMYGYLNAIPLNEERSFRLNLSASMSFTKSYTYQNVVQIKSIDMDNFDYGKFMEEFWGNSNGDKFYSGQSGFKESSTTSGFFNLGGNLYYENDFLEVSFGGQAEHGIRKYSLNKNANMNTWDYEVDGMLEIKTNNNFNIINKLDYKWYEGYSEGYGKSHMLWNFELHKSIKAVTLSLKVNDVLNQTVTFNRIKSANYVEDRYSGIIGRRFLFGITLNFGKMNTAKNRNATRSMLRMM